MVDGWVEKMMPAHLTSSACLGFEVLALGFEVLALGFEVLRLGFEVLGLGREFDSGLRFWR